TILEGSAAASRSADTPTTHASIEHSVAATTPSSSCKRRKHIAKKWVTPIVDMVYAALIKFDSDSGSDDDPLPYTPYAGWKMVPSPLGSVHAYHDMAGYTKHFTTLRELLHMVEKTDLQKLLGAVDKLYQQEDPNTFALLFWRLYPRAQVYILETVDGRIIYMFVDVSYPLTVATLERMLKHRLESLKYEPEHEDRDASCECASCPDYARNYGHPHHQETKITHLCNAKRLDLLHGPTLIVNQEGAYLAAHTYCPP
nr:hypothetical protein [Tanacetum cinerariifolium]